MVKTVTSSSVIRLSSLAVDHGVGFELDEPVRVNEPRYLHDRVRGTNRAEELAVDRGDGLPVLDASEQRSRSDHIVERRPGALQCVLDDRETAPGLCGWLEGRSRFARVGLLIHISASFMQPGLDNHQVLEMSNFGHLDLEIAPGTAICQFVFQRTLGGETPYEGQYKGQTPENFWRD